MSNPRFILSDSDALIQLFIAKQGAILAFLKGRFGITLAVTPEVEIEISSHRKFGNQFEQVLLRFIGSGSIVVLDDETVRDVLKEQGLTGALLDQSLSDIGDRSRTYHKHVGVGEAYTHVKALALQVPLMTHDIRAIETLRHVGLPVATPYLRFADLLVFARKVGGISKEECDRARATLDGQKEWLPQQLKSRRMVDADWDQFDCRITCDTQMTENSNSLCIEPVTIDGTRGGLKV